MLDVYHASHPPAKTWEEGTVLPILQMSKLSLGKENLPKVTQTLVWGSKGLKLEPMAFRPLSGGVV